MGRRPGQARETKGTGLSTTTTTSTTATTSQPVFSRGGGEGPDTEWVSLTIMTGLLQLRRCKSQAGEELGLWDAKSRSGRWLEVGARSKALGPTSA